MTEATEAEPPVLRQRAANAAINALYAAGYLGCWAGVILGFAGAEQDVARYVQLGGLLSGFSLLVVLGVSDRLDRTPAPRGMEEALNATTLIFAAGMAGVGLLYQIAELIGVL